MFGGAGVGVARIRNAAKSGKLAGFMADEAGSVSYEGGRKTSYYYDGVQQASEYLQSQGVPRAYRKQILESFDVETIKLQTAGDSTYGLRFYGGNANA